LPLSDSADVSVAEQRVRLLRWLTARGSGGRPTLRETHVSFLAFADERVWKCKKAVRFPFVDLSTAERRRRNCEREVALNRRLAPDVYLGVVPLENESDAVVDHLVEMRRLPDDSRLAAVAGRGSASGGDCVDAIADLLVRFHVAASTGGEIDRSAEAPALARLWERSLTEVRTFAGGVLEPLTVEHVAMLARRFVAGRAPLFAERIAAGRIRDGHGDLLADDVFCLPDGPRILDCLEFDDQLRFGDVLADVAFLAMDLERLGRRDLARRLLDQYEERSDDRWPASLEDFYIAYRALVRAKVACLRVADDAASAAVARDLLVLADSHLERTRVRVVLVGGPPATGKTTVATALARTTGWCLLRSDEIRKELAGIAPITAAAAPLDRGLYTKSWSDRTYAEIVDRARAELERGRSVILDASWSTADRRCQSERLATDTASELSSFRCDVAPEVAARRAATRLRQAVDASDASPSIADDLRARFAPWPAAAVVDTTQPPDILAEWMLTRLQLAGSRT
jgi:uncharacterized protein